MKLLIAIALICLVPVYAQAQNSIDQKILIDNCENKRRRIMPSDAASACTTLINSHPTDRNKLAVLYEDRGNAFDVSGDRDNAIKDFNTAIELAPNVAGFFYNRGVYYARNKEIDRAFSDYNSALQIDPKFFPALYNRGRIYSLHNDNDHALEDYNNTILIQPNFGLAYLSRALIYGRLKDAQKASADIGDALRLDPNLKSNVIVKDGKLTITLPN